MKVISGRAAVRRSDIIAGLCGTPVPQQDCPALLPGNIKQLEERRHNAKREKMAVDALPRQLLRRS